MELCTEIVAGPGLDVAADIAAQAHAEVLELVQGAVDIEVPAWLVAQLGVLAAVPDKGFAAAAHRVAALLVAQDAAQLVPLGGLAVDIVVPPVATVVPAHVRAVKNTHSGRIQRPYYPPNLPIYIFEGFRFT